MSMRDFLIPVKSIDSLRQIVGSCDQALCDEVLKIAEKDLRKEYGPDARMDDDEREEFDEQLEEIQRDLQNLVMTKSPLSKEPGGWIFCIEHIIKARQLEVKVSLPFNQGYKHYYAWEPYRKRLQSRLTAPALKAIEYLEHGRPLQGKEIDHDGCLFAWLIQAEIVDLYDCLSPIPAKEVGDRDLEEFHTDLVDALAKLKKKKCDLVLGAS